MQTGKNISQKYPTRKKDTFNIGARLVTYDILNVCEIAVSTSQNTASAYKARHTSPISYIIVIKKRRRRSETHWAIGLNEALLVKTAIKGQGRTAELNKAMLLSNNCQLGFSRQMKEMPAGVYFPAISHGDKRWVGHWNALSSYSY